MSVQELSRADADQAAPTYDMPPIRHRPKAAETTTISPSTTIEPPKRRRIVPVAPLTPQAPAEIAKPKRRRGHAKKDARGKWQKAGNYGVGFASPPLHSRFDGNRKGPGRPRGSRSQSSIIKEALDAKRVVNENGKRKKYRNRELASRLLVNTAIEKKNFKDLLALQELATRHFPEEQTGPQAQSPLGHAGLDQGILEQLFAGLKLGEPIPGAPGPLADALRTPAAHDDLPEQAWESEEDWDAPDEADNDPDAADV